MKIIKYLIARFARCRYAKKCRYYDKDHPICELDNGYGCGVCRDWYKRIIQERNNKMKDCETEEPKNSCQKKIDKVNEIWNRRLKRALSSQLKEVVGIIESVRPVDNGTVRYHESYNDGKRDLADEVKAEVEKLV